jgi:hypothetical protein
MSDLRTRIADVIARHRMDRSNYEMADAVIAELGLYREGNESRTVTNEYGATYRIEGGHRYVTDWEADDE